MSARYVVLPLSGPFHPPGARPVRQKPRPDGRIRVTVVLRSRSPEAATAAAISGISTQLPHQRRVLSPTEFEELYGAAPADVARVKSFARRHGLRVVEVSAARCCVVLSGSLAAFAKAFRTQFAAYEDGEGFFRSHTAPIRLPADMAAGIEAVLGLDDRPLLQRHFAVSSRQPLRRTDPREVARTYEFPRAANGTGQTVALLELGGGFYPADLRAYFARRKLRHPRIRVRSIDGRRNNPAPPQHIRFVLEQLGLPGAKAISVSRRAAHALPSPKSLRPARSGGLSKEDVLWAMWTIETTMDIQLLGSFANGADLVVYFAPGTAHGQYHAFTSAVHSPENPSVISCSFGSCENGLPPAYLHAIDRALRLAALKGVTVCFSSGDNGDDAQNGKPRVHFPASSPYVLACGGTHLDPAKKSGWETVWEEPGMPSLKSGGGVSEFFPEPAWQSTAQVKKKTKRSGRGVPDVAAKADLKTGYGIVVGGNYFPMGGTSAAAPLWAALVALLNQRLGARVGYLTPLLYARRLRGATRDIRRGSSGRFYRAAPGWDPCTGWGSPKGTRLLAALQGKKRRG